MEKRFNLDFELRSEANSFTGYAARFYDPNDNGTEYELLPGLFERIDRSAFKHITRDVVALYNHNPDMPIGRLSANTLDLRTDSKGLHFKIAFDKNDPDHRRLKAKIQNGTLRGCSFGFLVREEEFTREDKDIRTLKDIDLIEVSAGVTFPAYSGTSSKFRSEGIEIVDKYKLWQETQKRLERLTKY